jgi:drug/metabolite transporter (DMT)-like permease
MSIKIPIALVLALLSTTMTNLAYAREHDVAAELPTLSLRRPLASLRLLIANRTWTRAFVLESGGFLLYAVALALASLSLVQSVAAGGIGILAYVSARRARRRLRRREILGVSIAILGLVALAISLTGGGTEHGSRGTIVGILIWLGASAAAAAAILALGRGRLGSAAAHGLAGGVLFAVGDISTKVVTEGGARVAFFVTLVAGYTLGTSLLQIGYQAGGAITVAGLATLMTNALPIAAGTVVLEEGVPSGVLGALRAVAFAAVTAGAVLLARPDPQAPRDGGSHARPPPIESQQWGHG